MKFLPVDICKKLIEMGCKSDNDFYWRYGKMFIEPAFDSSGRYAEDISAFCLEDFVGNHKQAKENAKIIWNDCMEPVVLYQSMRNIIGCKSPISYRHAMIDSLDWIEYLTKHVEALK